MTKILLLANYSHDLFYFKKVQDYFFETKEDVICNLIYDLPIFFLEIFWFYKFFSISKEEIEDAILPTLKRKIAKYGTGKKLMYTIFLSITARLYYLKYLRILKNYDVIFLFGGLKVNQKIASLIALKLNKQVFYFENGPLPNTTMIDKNGTNYINSVPRNADFYFNIKPNFTPKPIVPRVGNNNMEQINLNGIKYIFCPFQVASDNQILLYSPWVASMYDFYEKIEYLANNTTNNCKFIIKLHPSCANKYEDLIQKNHHKIIFAGNSTAELIQKSIAVLTINSSVGIEALTKKKKVISIGNAFYNIDGVTFFTLELAKLLHYVNNIEELNINSTLILQFLTFLEQYYLLPESHREPSVEHFEKLYSKIF